jgi:hypothetical protein
MVTYKTIVSPRLTSNFSIKPDLDAQLSDYSLIHYEALDQTYGEVYLKSIRFTIAYPNSGTHNAEGYIFHPYQVHIKWIDGTSVLYQRGEIVQNTMVHNLTTGNVQVEGNMETIRPSYSTFCQVDNVAYLREPANQSAYNHGDTTWLFYNLQRDALVKQGSISNLNFEVFFTNLRGQQYMRYLPNVEIEFELF